MRALAITLMGAALAGSCSSDAPVTPADDDAVVATGSKAVTGQPGQSAPPAASPQGSLTGGMRGEVSTLTGDVSGLDVRVTDLGTIIDLPADALFEFDQADLTPIAETELRKAAEVIRRAPAGFIQIIGHTDSKGDDTYNQNLSNARARTVADWFGQQVGVRQRQLIVSGKGETAPIAPNETATGADNPSGRAKNRRVEVVLPNA